MKPKWLLTHPNGSLMFNESLAALDLSDVEEIILVCKKEHYDTFNVADILERQRRISSIKVPFRVAVIEPTASQPETVAVALRQLNITGPVFIKDSDNTFACKVSAANEIATGNLEELTHVTPAGKSYVELEEGGRISRVVEKEVISDFFCVGGYSFAKAEEFLGAYDALKDQPDLYVSHIIQHLIAGGAAFKTLPVTGYVDWGTIEEWDRYKHEFATLFIDLDGTIVKNSAYFFEPHWGESEGIPETITALNKLYDSGRVELIITTSRRSEFKEQTEKQLKKVGLRYHRILYDLSHSKRIVINDYTATNPPPSANAINIPRNATDLDVKLREFFKTLD